MASKIQEEPDCQTAGWVDTAVTASRGREARWEDERKEEKEGEEEVSSSVLVCVCTSSLSADVRFRGAARTGRTLINVLFFW